MYNENLDEPFPKQALVFTCLQYKSFGKRLLRLGREATRSTSGQPRLIKRFLFICIN